MEQPIDGSAGLAPGHALVRLIDEFGNFHARENIPISLGSRRIHPDLIDPAAIDALAYTDSSGTAVFAEVFVEARGTHVLTARFYDYLFLARKAAFAAIAGNSSCISRAEWGSYRAAQLAPVMQNSSAVHNASSEDGALDDVPGEDGAFHNVSGADGCLDLNDFLYMSDSILGSASGDAAPADLDNTTCTTAESEFYAEPGEQARICAARRSAATGPSSLSASVAPLWLL